MQKQTFLSIVFILNTIIIYSNVIVLNGLTHQHYSNDSQDIEGEIVIKNTGKENYLIEVVLNDMTQLCNEATAFSPSIEHPNSLSKYIELSNTEIEIEPGAIQTIVYKIKMPKNFDFTGSLWSLIMVDIKKPTTEFTNQKGIGISSNIRYAVQIILNRGKRISYELEFPQVNINTQSEKIKVDAALYNPTSFLSSPTITIEVYGANGDILFSKKSLAKKVYPTSCKSFLFEIETLPKGNYEGVLIADFEGNMIGTKINFDL